MDPENRLITNRNFHTRLCAGLMHFLCALAMILLSGAPDSMGEVATPAPIASAPEISYPPFCSVDTNGRTTGFSVELLTAAQEGVNFIQKPFSKKDLAVKVRCAL